jgi:endonuclease III-like uncharacterized protein
MRKTLSMIAHLLGGPINKNRIKINRKVFVTKNLKHRAKKAAFFNDKLKHLNKLSETFIQNIEYIDNIKDLFNQLYKEI